MRHVLVAALDVNVIEFSALSAKDAHAVVNAGKGGPIGNKGRVGLRSGGQAQKKGGGAERGGKTPVTERTMPK